MPKYVKRRYSKKKRGSKKKGPFMFTRPRQVLPRFNPVTGMAPTLYRELTFNGTIGAIGGLTDEKRYALNGMWDPNLQSGGTQPAYFDELMALYNGYEVLASRIDVEVLNIDGTLTGVVVFPWTNGAGPSVYSFSEACTQPMAKKVYVSDQRKVAKVSNYAKMSWIEGRTTASVNYTGSIVANPSTTREWLIISETVDGLTAMNHKLNVTITYYAKFFRRQNQHD